MMDSNFLAKELHTYVFADHTSKIKDLQNLMKERFNHDISYYKIWDAKQKAIANIQKNWEKSYQKLQKLLLAYKDSNLGTQVSFRSINEDIPGTIIFKYVFWAFAPSIAGFTHCRPVISIDGTHLYGKYRVKLLIAMATNTNNEIFLLAFAVMDGETGASWGWFLSCLRIAIRDVVPDLGICIILDRHRGIISSIAQWPNDYVLVYHRYCIRHMASNFNTQFNDKFLKSLALKVGFTHQDHKLEKILDCLKEAKLKFSKDPNPNIAKKKLYSYLMKEGLEKWTLSYDGGHRYRTMTTNMSECFNRVLKGARGLLISTLVDYIWCKLVAYFNDRRTKILGDIKHGQEFNKHAMETYEANYEKETRHYVRPFNQKNGVYQVCTTHNPHRSDGGDHSHEVRLLENTCTCGKWEIYKIPCSHVIAVCIREHVNAMRYINPCYTLQQ